MISDVIDTLVDWVEAAGAAMIVAGLLITLFRVVRVPFLQPRPPLAVLQIRLGLGMFLALGLEFLLAADILRTAVSPTFTEIGQLAAIAAIRTGLNYFLGREFIEGEREIAALEAARLDLRAAGPPGRPRRTTHDAPKQPVVSIPVNPVPTTSQPPPQRGVFARWVSALRGPAGILQDIDHNGES